MNGEQASREKDGGRSTDLKSKWEGGSAGNSETLLCKERKCRSLRGGSKSERNFISFEFFRFQLGSSLISQTRITADKCSGI